MAVAAQRVEAVAAGSPPSQIWPEGVGGRRQRVPAVAAQRVKKAAAPLPPPRSGGGCDGSPPSLPPRSGERGRGEGGDGGYRRWWRRGGWRRWRLPSFLPDAVEAVAAVRRVEAVAGLGGGGFPPLPPSLSSKRQPPSLPDLARGGRGGGGGTAKRGQGRLNLYFQI